MKKVVGVRHSQGTFEGNSYDNFVLYVTDASTDKDCIGICPQPVKVRSKVFYEYVHPDKIKNLIGKELDIYYDAYKNVCKLEISKNA